MAQRALTDDEKKRVEAAREAIDAICDNYHVALVPTMVVMQGNIVQHSVGILPQKEERRIVVPEINKDKIPPINMEG
jgi:hypothetical protein